MMEIVEADAPIMNRREEILVKTGYASGSGLPSKETVGTRWKT
jgi:hypothetical protein